MTSPDITPHALSHTTHYTTLHTQHHIAPQPKLANLLCSLDCVCGVGVWVVCVLCLRCVCCVFRFVVCIVRVLGSVVCVFRVVSVVCARRHQSRRPSSRLCRLVAVALCLCVLCVMRFLVHTPAYGDCVSVCVCCLCVGVGSFTTL